MPEGGMKQQAFEVCLALIETEGWKSFSFAKAAEISGLPLSVFHENFSSPIEILLELFRQIDREVLNMSLHCDDESPRDRLFEILMARFDAAQPYKRALGRFWEDWGQTLPETPSLACQGVTSMGWMLEAASIGQQGLPGMLRVQGLTVLYFLTLKTWLSDDSPDLGKTMAFLNKGLSQLEGIATFLNRL